MIWAQALQASLPSFWENTNPRGGVLGELHPRELNLEQIPNSESLQTFQGPEGHQTVTSTTCHYKKKKKKLLEISVWKPTMGVMGWIST